MHLLKRGSGIYLYKATRKNGKPRNEYLASGDVALLIYEAVQRERAEEQERRRALQALVEEDRWLDAELAGLAEEAQAAARELLEAAGYYYRHVGGGWRRRRHDA
jgi:hypothetical protein